MRHHSDWLQAFVEYASYGEAPVRMYFWAGVSALAGALRRKVWMDQAYFRWYPNFYVIFVAPPGIVSKSTTASISHNLLRKVPGINYGPDIVTGPALVGSFAKATEGFDYQGEIYTMSALTLEASEFGNLLNPQDRDMIDLFVTLWDGSSKGIRKETKHCGDDVIENPWINLIACTTPSWIADNFPKYLVGGGFTSRCVFVYADKKRKLVAYPGYEVPPDLELRADTLVRDLIHISERMVGEFQLTPGAIAWGRNWYEEHYASSHKHLDGEQFGGYLARKQTHIHKLAMVLAASESDELLIKQSHLEVACEMVTDLEIDLPKVYTKIGKSDASVYTDKLLQYVKVRGEASYMDVYRFVHSHFPSVRDFEDVLEGCVRAGYLGLQQTETGGILRYIYSPMDIPKE